MFNTFTEVKSFKRNNMSFMVVLAADALKKDQPLKGWRCPTKNMGPEFTAL